jgi:hypothetical protein
MGNEIQRAFEVKGMKVPYDAEGRASLTALWIAAGRPKAKKPDKWLRNQEAIELMASVQKTESLNRDSVMKSKPGKGTWGHWKIALAYANWMDPEIYQRVLDGYRQWQEEEKNPGLKLDRAVEKLKKLGKADAWIEIRLKGKLQRIALTDKMAEHQCDGVAYPRVTDIGNLTAVGFTAKEFLKHKGLPENTSTRDNMTRVELAAIMLFEASTEQEIVTDAAIGNAQCIASAMKVSELLQPAMKQLRSRAIGT